MDYIAPPSLKSPTDEWRVTGLGMYGDGAAYEKRTVEAIGGLVS